MKSSTAISLALGWLLAGASASWTGPTRAQAAGEEESRTSDQPAPGGDTSPRGPAPSLEPPVLVERAEAVYPPSARAAGIAGDVILRLTIDRTGRVTEAEIVESPGAELGESAREAALRSRFEPARRDGVPVASRILHKVEFRLEPPRAEAPAVPPAEASASHRAEAPAPRAPGPGALRQQAPIEVSVRGLSQADRLRRSAKAVHVVETEQARRESADLGEVLSRSEGIGVRRSGGLGSSARFSLDGLTDDQVRFFLDGVPLELSGFGLGIANVPVNLVERIEIYRGVVPIHFGIDALGGAVNLVSDQDHQGTHAAASYQVGSFGTHRATLSARTLHEETGLLASANTFFDHAENDYPVDVEAPDQRGRLRPVRVHRFHDAYQAVGGGIELGFVDRPWAKRLLARVFATDYDKELQHNLVMTVPYGEVAYGERVLGATLRYEQPALLRARSAPVSLAVLGSFTRRTVDFADTSAWVYDWFGRRIRERRTPGEIGGGPTDQTIWDHSALGRLEVGWIATPGHTLRLAVSPTFTRRAGEDRRNTEARDPLSARRDLLRVVTGLEYQIDLLDRRLENIAFVKDYVMHAASEEPVPGSGFRPLEQDAHRLGVGDALRWSFAEWIWAKASYEHATRLPRPDEIFGDSVLVATSLELEPETSHNANLGVTATAPDAGAGTFRANLNGFLRHAERLIVLLGNDKVLRYQNVYAARALGVEAALQWTSPGERAVLDGNVTYQDLRNVSTDGAFRDFAGDRIPNRPWLLANASARIQIRGVATPGDELAPGYNLRYVHEFLRSWESLGVTRSKQAVPSQLVHSLSLTYLVRRGATAVSSSLEVQNLTDEQVYDFFGQQKPGRAFFFKGTIEM